MIKTTNEDNLSGKPKNPPLGRPNRIWEDNVDVEEIGCKDGRWMDWLDVMPRGEL
jgi:hypothetical protein